MKLLLLTISFIVISSFISATGNEFYLLESYLSNNVGFLIGSNETRFDIASLYHDLLKISMKKEVINYCGQQKNMTFDECVEKKSKLEDKSLYEQNLRLIRTAVKVLDKSGMNIGNSKFMKDFLKE
ncbi:hypothetical protein CMO90_00560 [Candidatus Woesearchaeota archaeon]|jgi:hypothetical protein|nr:hypothetical protein [Candidatus Woesearchaeota archaeon]|tara:strand:- start:215 stop:592 length:378 start_codon:yes stop_codon:yes gene_type:complete